MSHQRFGRISLLMSVSALLLATSTVLLPQPTHAAALDALTPIVASPVNDVVSTLQQTLAPTVASAPTTVTTALAPTATTDTSSDTPATTTIAPVTPTVAMAASEPIMQVSASTTPVISGVASTSFLSNQAVVDPRGAAYTSGQISTEAAHTLYRIAAGIGLLGFLLYAATLLPRRTRRDRTLHTQLKTSRQP